MEESKKKQLLIGVIIVCLAVAGIITYATRSGTGNGDFSEFKGQQVWLKCANESCGATFDIDKAEYYKKLDEYMAENPMTSIAPAFECPQCGQQSAYEAVKCKCGNIFFPQQKGSDFADRCPKCKYSQIEEDRKVAAEKRKSGQ